MLTTPTLSDPKPLIYFLTVNYYCATLVSRLLESISAAADCPYHLVIVNNSVCERQSMLLPTEHATVLDSPDNVGFGRGCNLGLEWIFSRDADALVWLINPDARLLDPISLADVHTFIRKQHSLAILGTAVVTDTGEQWFGGGCFNSASGTISSQVKDADCELAMAQDGVQACDWVSGCSMLIDMACFDRYPRFDPAFFLYYEDFDFCQRYQSQGYTVAITHRFSAIHTPSSVTNRNQFDKLNHSTFSYLLVLSRYTSPGVRLWRFLRLFCMAIALLPLKPAAAFGKLYGVARYLSKSE